ncbi:putative ATPase component of ABC transporter with duplicated ATPase domains [Vibrio metschnikovii]|uniref:hypothetical protein n=1 Tax=Vibrio metschnikovii TaxID=28172 RepID=UPI000DFFD667|nr:hypothetical protein [Vibrio metschnikovii]SUP50951.1 putative ATPase component of ABC transporter with duplicated ATPase domains [Vibrio metschnikovii]
MIIEKAIYNAAILPEHQGNPLIEALRPKRSWEEILEELSNYPDYSEHIAEDPDPLVRDEYLNRIDELRQPLVDYMDCFRAIERALKKAIHRKIHLAQLLPNICIIL